MYQPFNFISEIGNILVTGAAGFIGSHLSERLLKEGFHVIGIDNFDSFYDRSIKEANLASLKGMPGFSFYEADLIAPEEIQQITEKVDAVVHLAAKAGVLPSIKDPKGYLDANLGATMTLLEFMRERNIKKYVFASSSSVYGNNKKIPFSETDAVDNPISPYAFSKKSGELLNHTYHHLYNIDTVNLRFFTVFGPRQRPDLAIHKFFRLIYDGQPVTLYGDGGTARDYTFVQDTVTGIVAALRFVMKNEGVFETFNLGNNSPVALKDLIKNIYEVIGKDPNIQYKPMQPGDVDITYADIDKAKKMLGYNPQTSLLDGLKAFNEWYNEKN
ncbi:NAD-dependent epimerase/dehydratase family protein [Rufibacter immobilis]|uniref:NAD-dependent epimerase/dehydratase family protein n=1 Tax=Rufibacter immobilis TaxID=1348778 RepID=A0A3M9MZ99_9BACT|nr:GDP-mannose 4,6-dehydratase [Rufibacter immobilis]RNI30864.1 NAD-dependent epimerase/dehydratase family protein [Rufibacter immobilis]